MGRWVGKEKVGLEPALARERREADRIVTHWSGEEEVDLFFVLN